MKHITTEENSLSLEDIQAKNKLAYDIKEMFRGEQIPESIFEDFEAIEAIIGLGNEKSAREILKG